MFTENQLIFNTFILLWCGSWRCDEHKNSILKKSPSYSPDRLVKNFSTINHKVNLLFPPKEGNVFAFCPTFLFSENLDQSRNSITGFEIVSLPFMDNYSI